MILKLVLISDTHNLHDLLEMPDGDILLFAGDMADSGTLDEIANFNRFLGTLPYKHKVIVCGNHDFAFERQSAEARALITNATYLQDESVTIEGVKIFGSPWTPWFHDWAFNLHRGQPIGEKWGLIPTDTDILITHGPPMGVLDKIWTGKPVGCEALTERLQAIQPKLHLFGHIHESAGHLRMGETLFVNGSMAPGPLSKWRKKVKRPIVANYDTATGKVEIEDIG